MPALIAAGIAVAVGDAWLVAVCWKHRSVLGGVLGAIGIALVAFALATGPGRGVSKAALLGAGVALVIGMALFVIGQALERLLEDEGEP